MTDEQRHEGFTPGPWRWSLNPTNPTGTPIWICEERHGFTVAWVITSTGPANPTEERKEQTHAERIATAKLIADAPLLLAENARLREECEARFKPCASCKGRGGTMLPEYDYEGIACGQYDEQCDFCRGTGSDDVAQIVASFRERQAKLVEALREVREVVEEFNYYKAYDIIDAALSLVPNQGTKP